MNKEDIEREAIRAEIKTMSLEELQKLKKELTEQISNKDAHNSKSRRRQMFTRETKSGPIEVSSKLPVSYYKPKYEGKKYKTRDPRFDPKCGTFDEKHFKEHFKFVDELKSKEKDILIKQMEETTDKEQKKKIKFLIQRLSNQLREKDKKEKDTEMQKEEKMKMKALRQKGEKPIYQKKSEKKLLSLLTKYDELKTSKKVEQHVQKMVKKSAKKQLRNIKQRN